jgi:protein involved in polysaccharide export with SLBB domain
MGWDPFLVIKSKGRRVEVSGEVAIPGRYSFQEIPDLWSVIMKAGGPTASAYLGEVRILRGEGEGMRSISVDLSSYLLGGDRQALPRLQPRDTVYIPRTSVIGTDVFGGKTVYVFGEVAKPGAYLIGPAETVVGALLLAGGPTPLADRGRVRLVREESDRRVVTELDLDDYFRYGDGRDNPPLRPGDTIEVSQSRGNRFRSVMANIAPGLTFVTATVSAVLIYDRLNDNR